MGRREELYPEIVRMRSEGLLLREIGERLGISLKTVQDYLSDPDGSRARARKRKAMRPCADCGEPCNFGRGALHPVSRCPDCAKLATRVWTDEVILAAIQAWVAEYGVIPKSTDWQPSLARQRGFHDRAQRFVDAKGRWPWSHMVAQRFGSWNNAITAAGYVPRPVGRSEAA